MDARISFGPSTVAVSRVVVQPQHPLGDQNLPEPEFPQTPDY
jgi:hypothetical protein